MRYKITTKMPSGHVIGPVIITERLTTFLDHPSLRGSWLWSFDFKDKSVVMTSEAGHVITIEEV